MGGELYLSAFFLPKLKPESNTVIFWFSISRKGEKRDREKIGVKIIIYNIK